MGLRRSAAREALSSELRVNCLVDRISGVHSAVLAKDGANQGHGTGTGTGGMIDFVGSIRQCSGPFALS